MREPLSIIDVFSAELPFATEFRRLLHRVRRQNEQGEVKTLLTTSAMLAEGKSTVTALLAVTAAREKELRTLVIDSDLRRPSIHKFFALDRSPGLAEVISRGEGPLDIVRKTKLENLHVLTAGSSQGRPAEIFDADAVGRVIDEMKFYYDLILVDCAPVLPVSDPMLLGSKVDGVLLVVKAGATQKEVVTRAVEILDSNQVRIMGVIMNNMENRLPYYYDYKYYGYDYTPDEKPSTGTPSKPGAPPSRDTKAASPSEKPGTKKSSKLL